MKTAAPATVDRSDGHPPGYRLAVLSRVVAAVFGGYALATMLPILLSIVMPMPKGQAVMTAMLLSFTVYTGAIIWVFAARSASRAWAGVLIPTVMCTVLWWVFKA